MKKIELEHVERLTRGKRSGINIGSRFVGHHLRPHERACYQRALKKGYLDITAKDRDNLWHIWEKACQALECDFLVLIKLTETGKGAVYCNNDLVFEDQLDVAKQHIRNLVI